MTYGFIVIIPMLVVQNQLDIIVLDHFQTNYDILLQMIYGTVLNSNSLSSPCSAFLLLLSILSSFNNTTQHYKLLFKNQLIQIIMLSPLKSQQAMDSMSIIREAEPEPDTQIITIGSTFQYPKHFNFLSTPSTSYKHRNQLKQSLQTFIFPVFDLSKMRSSNKMEVKSGSQQTELQKKQENAVKLHKSELAINLQKPQPFMGAFLQTQKQFDCFNLNIKIPSLQQMKPFSRILTESLVRESYQKQEQSHQISVKNVESADKNQQLSNSLYTMDLALSQIEVEPAKQQQSETSNFWTEYQSKKDTFQKEYNRKMYRKMWQDQSEDKDYFNPAYEFHSSKCRQFIDRVQSRILLSEKLTDYTQSQICCGIVKMMLGVESDLFKLQYHQLVWTVTDVPAKFQHMLRTSLQNYLQDILMIANYKSRLEEALNFVKKQAYRRILQEVGFQAREFLHILQEISLQLVEMKASFLDSVLTLTQYKTSIALIYELLINESWVKSQNKSYMDFDVSFLNSEAVIFRQIVRMSNNNDMLFGKSYELCLKILRAAFKPITFTLNRIVFEEVTQISNRDDTYLRFYFQNLKDLLSYLGKRIDLIKNQSNDLYMICRKKQKIDIVVETNQLEAYLGMWNNLFATKRKMIQRIQYREKKRLKQLKQKKEEQKIKQIYQLKTKLLKSIEETKKKKSEIYLEGIKEIQKLKRDIAEREERRRLNYLIQKQQQKGFLLDAELKQKRKLIHQKEELLLKAEQDGIHLVEKLIQQKLEVPIIKREEINNVVNKVENQKDQKLKQKQKQKKQIGSQRVQSIIKSEMSLEQERKFQKAQQIGKDKNMATGSEKMIKTISKMSSISVAGDRKNESESQVSNGEFEQQQQQKQNLVVQAEMSDIHVSTNTVLELCIDTIIRQQIQITNMAMSYLVYDQYQLMSIMEFMRKLFLNGNGQGLTNFTHLSIASDSRIGLQYFRDCQLFDISDQFLLQLGPEFYQVHSILGGRDISRGVHAATSINIFQENLDAFIGFQFNKLPVLLEPYFSYIHLSKYMQIFSYILKINHCLQLTSSCLLILNQYSGSLKTKRNEAADPLLKKLYLTRHSIHIFLNTLQSYLFHRIIEKQLKILRTKLKSRDINELAIVHLNMLDCIIRKGLIQNSFNDISKKIKGLLMQIRKFKNVVDSYCANDIHSYVKPEIESQIQNMFRVFREQQNFLQSLFYHP